jgi:hypothetical protein
MFAEKKSDVALEQLSKEYQICLSSVAAINASLQQLLSDQDKVNPILGSPNDYLLPAESHALCACQLVNGRDRVREQLSKIEGTVLRGVNALPTDLLSPQKVSCQPPFSLASFCICMDSILMSSRFLLRRCAGAA